MIIDQAIADSVAELIGSTAGMADAVRDTQKKFPGAKIVGLSIEENKGHKTFHARAKYLMQKYEAEEMALLDAEPPETVRHRPPRKIVRRVGLSLAQTPEQVQAERQRIEDRYSARLEAIGPCPDLAGLGMSFNQDSDVMRTATRYVDAWEKKRAGIERWRYAPLRDDDTEEIEQAAFEESLGSLKLLKKEFDDAQQRVIEGIMEPYYASLQAAP